jgi:hypothetical protein
MGQVKQQSLKKISSEQNTENCMSMYLQNCLKLETHFLLKKNYHAVNYFIFIIKRLIRHSNLSNLMQFLTDSWYLSWCHPYSLKNLVPVYYYNSINKAKIKVDDSKKFQFTFVSTQNRDPFSPPFYEIFKCLSNIKNSRNLYLSLTKPAYHIIVTALSIVLTLL